MRPKLDDARNNLLRELREFRNEHRDEGRAVGAFVRNEASRGHYLLNVRSTLSVRP